MIIFSIQNSKPFFNPFLNPFSTPVFLQTSILAAYFCAVNNLFNKKINYMKTRNLFMSLTLMCGLFCIAFTFDKSGMYWFWSESKPVVFILAPATIIFGLLWFRAARILKKVNNRHGFYLAFCYFLPVLQSPVP